MRPSALRIFAIAMVCGSVVGCDELGPESSELERNRERWLDTRPVGYTYAVERLCFCGVESRGPVRVTVVGSLVTARVYVDSGQPVPSPSEDLFPTVDELFDLLQSAYDQDAHEVRVTYDADTGVPIDFWIDYQLNLADEELGMTVTESVEASPVP